MLFPETSHIILIILTLAEKTDKAVVTNINILTIVGNTDVDNLGCFVCMYEYKQCCVADGVIAACI